VESKKIERRYWTCPRCGAKNSYLKNVREAVPCEMCGWAHIDKKPYEIPRRIAIRLK